MRASKLLLIVSLMVLWPRVGLPAAAVFNGSTVKILKSILDINGNAQVLSGSTDPTSVAVSAPKGSVYLNTSTGLLYRKTDAGSSTNWQTFLTRSDLDGTTVEYASSVVRIKDSGVTTAKIADSNVTTAKIADSNVTTAKIADSNVTTAKIADANVTRAKLAAVGQQVSSSTGVYSTTSSSYTDITNLSVTITTTGRPVFMGLIAGASSDPGSSFTISRSGSATANCRFNWRRDSTDIATIEYISNLTGVTSSVNVSGNPGLFHFDPVAAGTYTYKLQAKSVSGTSTCAMNEMKIFAYEL